MYTPQAPVTFSSVDTKTASLVRKFVLENYGLKLTSLEKFDEKTVSSDVYLAHLNTGDSLVIKYSHWFSDEGIKAVEALSLAYELSEALRSDGVALPWVYKNCHGLYVTPSESGVVVIMEYLEGSHFSPLLESFYSAGKGLGNFNRAGKEVIKDPSFASRVKDFLVVDMPYDESRALYGDGLREVLLEEHVCAFPAVCEAFRSQIDLVDATIKLVDQDGAGSQDRSFGLLHFDFHVNNGLYNDKGELTGFLDIDQMTIGPHIWDVGNSLVSLISNAYDNDAKCDIPSLTKAFLSGYHTTNPLTKGEYQDTLIAGIKFDVLRLLRSLRRHRFESNRHSHLYGKIPSRILPRFKELPRLFEFFDSRWIESEILQA